MNCLSIPCRVDANGASPHESVELPLPPQAKRQAAVLYLKAAAASDSAAQRALLRRLAAELVLPRQRDPLARRAC